MLQSPDHEMDLYSIRIKSVIRKRCISVFECVGEGSFYISLSFGEKLFQFIGRDIAMSSRVLLFTYGWKFLF